MHFLPDYNSLSPVVLQDPDLPLHLISYHFPPGLFLQALGAPGFSFSASPLAHSYVPLLLSRSQPLTVGWLYAKVSLGMHLREGFSRRSALSEVWLRAAGQSLQAGANGECKVPEQDSPLAGEGLRRHRLSHQHRSMGLQLLCKPWENGLQPQRFVSGKSTPREKERVQIPFPSPGSPQPGPPPLLQSSTDISLFLPPRLSFFSVVTQ